MGEVTVTHHGGFAGVDQSVFGVRFDRFEQPEPRRLTLVGAHDKRLRLERFDVDRRGASFERRHGRDGVEVEPLDEHSLSTGDASKPPNHPARGRPRPANWPPQMLVSRLPSQASLSVLGPADGDYIKNGRAKR